MSETTENRRGTEAARGEGARAGRGVVFIAFAKIYFMFAGAVIEFGLPRFLTTSVFGAYKIVTSLVSPINNVIVTGTIQAVSKFTAAEPERASEISHAGMRMHMLVGLPMAVFFASFAPVWGWFFFDEAKAGPIALSSAIIACYAMYSVLVGRANGQKRFIVQAGLDVSFASARAALIVGMAVAGLGLYGAIAGWIAAAVLILCVSLVVVGVPKIRDVRQPLAPMIKFFFGVAVYLTLLNLLMVADQLLLKRFAGEWYFARSPQLQSFVTDQLPAWMAIQVGEINSGTAADTQVAFYGAVQNLSRLSYQAIIAVTFVIFPLVSQSTFRKDRDATIRYVSATLRYSFLFAAIIATLFAANPSELFAIPYPQVYVENGALALAPLAFGYLGFAMFVICGTILNGAGKTRAAIIAAAITLVLGATVNVLVLYSGVPGKELLLGLAVATGSAMLLGAAIAGFMVRRALGATLPVKTIARSAIAIGCVLAAGRVIPGEGLGVLFESAGLGFLFVFVLLVTGELSRADLRGILSVARRG